MAIFEIKMTIFTCKHYSNTDTVTADYQAPYPYTEAEIITLISFSLWDVS